MNGKDIYITIHGIVRYVSELLTDKPHAGYYDFFVLIRTAPVDRLDHTIP